MVYHMRSKVSLPSLITENHKGKRKVTNDKLYARLLKKCISDELVPSLEQKIKKLEEKVFDMLKWEKLLLFANPIL